MSLQNMFNANLFNTALAVGTDYMFSGLLKIGGDVVFPGFIGNLPGINGGVSSRWFHASLVGIAQFFGENIRALIQKVVPVGARAASVEQALLGPVGNGLIIGGFYYAAQRSEMIQSQINLRGDGWEYTTAAVGAMASSSIAHQGSRVLYPILFGKPATGL